MGLLSQRPEKARHGCPFDRHQDGIACTSRFESRIWSDNPTTSAGPLKTPELQSGLLPWANPTTSIEQILDAIIRRGDSVQTRRAYAGDLTTFARWLAKLIMPPNEAGFEHSSL
jgi:hypothetical protein